jgi:hypothetical protein
VAQHSNSSSKKNRLSLLALEPRLVFDGAVAVDTAVKITTEIDHQLFDRIPATAAPLLSQAQQEAQRNIAAWMQQADAAKQLAQIFGGGQASPLWLDQAQSVVQAFQRGELQVRTELRSSEELNGAWGAFATHGVNGQPVLYLNADWLASPGLTAHAVGRVMTEEWGHYLDTQLNGALDTAGDEGEAFSNAVYHVTVAATDQQRIASENDHLWITIDNQPVEVEMASLLFTGKVFYLCLIRKTRHTTLATTYAAPCTRLTAPTMLSPVSTVK